MDEGLSKAHIEEAGELEVDPLESTLPPKTHKWFLYSYFYTFLILTLFPFIGSMQNTCSSLAAKAPPKKAPSKSKSGKGKKRAMSPIGSDAPAQLAAKKQRTTKHPADAEPEADSSELASCVQTLVELALQLVCLLPASTLIPKKEPVGSCQVNLKCLPTWNLEPGLETFGPYIKKAGVAYTCKIS